MIILLIYLSHFYIIFSHDETVKTANTECEVVQFYEIITPEQGTKVLTKSGEVEEATFILKPVRIDEGTYEVEITRKAQIFIKSTRPEILN
jgi:tRNA A58 N-methylase Trm61